MTTGLASAFLSVGLMDIDIEALNTEGEFMVLYSDVSNGGTMTATAGQVGGDTNFVCLSSFFALFVLCFDVSHFNYMFAHS